MGFWADRFFASSFWAPGFWAGVAAPVAEETFSGGWGEWPEPLRFSPRPSATVPFSAEAVELQSELQRVRKKKSGVLRNSGEFNSLHLYEFLLLDQLAAIAEKLIQEEKLRRRERDLVFVTAILLGFAD